MFRVVESQIRLLDVGSKPQRRVFTMGVSAVARARHRATLILCFTAISAITRYSHRLPQAGVLSSEGPTATLACGGACMLVEGNESRTDCCGVAANLLGVPPNPEVLEATHLKRAPSISPAPMILNTGLVMMFEPIFAMLATYSKNNG